MSLVVMRCQPLRRALGKYGNNEVKLYKSDDGFLDHLVKITTILSLGFGVWAYFNTIHPVFEKEKELQQAKIDNQLLVSTKHDLNSQLKDLKAQVLAHEESITLLREQEAELNSMMVYKENELKTINSKLGEAKSVAVLNKLNYYMDKMINGYLLAISTGKKEQFDAVDYAKKLLTTHDSDSDPYNQEAFVFFKNYVENFKDQKVQGDDVIEFSVRLPLQYRIKYGL
ncbi:TPA: hypothetical protein ACGF3T_003270 [Vibrio cholerae]